MTERQTLPAADPRRLSTDMGELIDFELEGRRTQRFAPVRPVLSYHEGGLLILGGSYVMDGGRVVARRGPARELPARASDAKAVSAGRARYRRDHWGLDGARGARRLEAADPRLASTAIAEIVAVTYRTKKGTDRVLTDYRHPFKRPRPVLAWNLSGLLISGGVYHVTERGIID